MTAPLPTPDEIVKDVVVRHLTIVKVCDLNVYEGEQAEQIERYLKEHLSARLRPAWEQHEETRKMLVAQCAIEYERVVALRASLARKDEALRACAEALAPFVTELQPASLSRETISVPIAVPLKLIYAARAALARPGVKEIQW